MPVLPDHRHSNVFIQDRRKSIPNNNNGPKTTSPTHKNKDKTSPVRAPSGRYQPPLDPELRRELDSLKNRAAESSLPGDLASMSLTMGRTPFNTQEGAPVVPGMMGGQMESQTFGRDEVLGRFASEEGEIVEDGGEGARAPPPQPRARVVEETPSTSPEVPPFRPYVFPEDQRPRARPAQRPTTPKQTTAKHQTPQKQQPSALTLETSSARRRLPANPVLDPDQEEPLSQAACPYQASAEKVLRRQDSRDPDFEGDEEDDEDEEEEDSDSQSISGEIESILPNNMAPQTPARKRRSQSPARVPTASSSKKLKSLQSDTPAKPSDSPTKKLQIRRITTPEGRAKRRDLDRQIKTNWGVKLSQAIPMDLWLLDSQTKVPVSPKDWSNPAIAMLLDLSSVTRGRVELAVAALREVVGTRGIVFRGDVTAARELVTRGEWVAGQVHGEDVMDVDVEVDTPTLPSPDSTEDELASSTTLARSSTSPSHTSARPISSNREDSARLISVKQESPILPAAISRNLVLSQIESRDISALDGDVLIRLSGLINQEMQKRMNRAPAGHAENPWMIE